MTIPTNNWNFDKPEVGEGDTAENWAATLDQIDEALLTPNQKADLIDGTFSTLHRHLPEVHGNSFHNVGDPVGLTAAGGNSKGASGLVADAGHKHALPAAAPTGLTVGGGNTEGTSTSVARADHKHALPAFGTGAGTICQGNDSRILSQSQKDTLVGGGDAKSLHTHSDKAAATHTHAVGVGVSNFAQLKKIDATYATTNGKLTAGSVAKWCWFDVTPNCYGLSPLQVGPVEAGDWLEVWYLLSCDDYNSSDAVTYLPGMAIYNNKMDAGGTRIACYRQDHIPISLWRTYADTMVERSRYMNFMHKFTGSLGNVWLHPGSYIKDGLPVEVIGGSNGYGGIDPMYLTGYGYKLWKG